MFRILLIFSLFTLSCSSQTTSQNEGVNLEKIEGTQVKNRELGLSVQNLPFRHVIIGLDGVPFETFKRAQEKGLFKQFQRPSKMVSTYPSLSQIGWAKMFDLGTKNAYQSPYFSWDLNRKVMNLGQNADFSEVPQVADWKDKKVLRKLINYVSSSPKATKSQFDDFEKALMESSEPRVFFTIFAGTDAVTHTKGEESLMPLLEILDEKLSTLQQRHFEALGLPLEITIASDHGNTLVKSQPSDLRKRLKDEGYRFKSELESDFDIVDIGVGMLGSVTLWMKEARVKDVAQILAKDESVEVVTYQSGQYYVAENSNGYVKFEENNNQYRIVEQTSDVLDLGRQGLSLNTWYSQEDIFQASIRTNYPDSLQRIVEGFEDVTHPASLIVSLKTGYEYAQMTFFRAAQKIKPNKSGTHGGLQAADSNGVLVSTHKTYPEFVPAREVALRTDGVRDWDKRSPISLRFREGKWLDVVLGPKAQAVESVKVEVARWNRKERRYSEILQEIKFQAAPTGRSRNFEKVLPVQAKDRIEVRLILDDEIVVKTRLKVPSHTINRILYLPHN